MNVQSPQTALIREALGYAATGWHVFPVARDTKGRFANGRSSHPLEHGHNEGSCDPAIIRRWWTRWPDANIGLSLSASGLVTLDPDTYKPDCGWDAFIVDKVIPDTLAQRSLRDGQHYIFAVCADASFPGHLCTGVEVEHRGYIMLALSSFEGRSYVRENENTPAPVPDWVPRKGDEKLTSAAGGATKTIFDLNSRSDTASDEVEELLFMDRP